MEHSYEDGSICENRFTGRPNRIRGPNKTRESLERKKKYLQFLMTFHLRRTVVAFDLSILSSPRPVRESGSSVRWARRPETPHFAALRDWVRNCSGQNNSSYENAVLRVDAALRDRCRSIAALFPEIEKTPASWNSALQLFSLSVVSLKRDMGHSF